MPNKSTTGVVTLESLMNAPMLKDDILSAEDALASQLKPVDDVLPGLKLKEDDIIIPGSEPAVVIDALVDPSISVPPVLDIIVDPLVDEPAIIPTVESSTSTVYKDTLKKMWGETLGNIVTEVDGEEVEMSIDDIDMDEETFLAIMDSKLEEIKESAIKNKISTEGVSEFTKSLIDIEKNGGNLTELLKVKQSYVDPLEGLDLNILEDQKEVIYLRHKAAGQEDADIHRLIRMYESEGIVEEEAIKSNDVLRAGIDATVAAEVLKAELGVKERDARFKEYKTNLRTSLNQFELNDKTKSKLMDIATKQNEEGKFELDNRYNEYRMDPEKAARIALFLSDEEEFIKQVTKKAVTEKQLDTARKIKIIPRSTQIVEPKRSIASDRSVNMADLLNK